MQNRKAPSTQFRRPPVATRPPSWRTAWLLYVSVVAAKPLYAVFVFAVPWITASILRPLDEAFGTSMYDYPTASFVWLAALVALTILTAVPSMRLVAGADAALAAADAAGDRQAFRRLLAAWVLQDSICLWGLAARFLRYPAFWAYGFVAVSTVLTIAAGAPLRRALLRERS